MIPVDCLSHSLKGKELQWNEGSSSRVKQIIQFINYWLGWGSARSPGWGGSLIPEIHGNADFFSLLYYYCNAEFSPISSWNGLGGKGPPTNPNSTFQEFFPGQGTPFPYPRFFPTSPWTLPGMKQPGILWEFHWNSIPRPRCPQHVICDIRNLGWFSSVSSSLGSFLSLPWIFKTNLTTRKWFPGLESPIFSKIYGFLLKWTEIFALFGIEPNCSGGGKKSIKCKIWTFSPKFLTLFHITAQGGCHPLGLVLHSRKNSFNL